MRQVYEAALASGALRPDEAQAAAAAQLEALSNLIKGYAPKKGSGLFRAKPQAPPPGLYLWGAVGRGKTALMDLFFADAAVARKRRVHFHEFMRDVHARVHIAREARSSHDALIQVAAALADEAHLLCLDEMQVTDIADAMILGRLFDALWQRGVVIVTTSNFPPDGLYKDGLNRQLFLPCIAAMTAHLDVVELASATDYRLGRVKGYETFVTPLGPRADLLLQSLWQRLTETDSGQPMEIDVLGRKLRVPQAARGAARFPFAELCEAPLGSNDYLALAQNFQTVFIEHIPALDSSKRNEAKRFVLLIDTLYDARIRLVASSEKPPAEIYPAGDHSFEFARTASRLEEMQSASWWGRRIVET
jgi:cell division protein ZapE